MTEWGRKGLIYELTGLMEQYDEDGSIKAFYEEKVPGSWALSLLDDGTTYWFSELFGNKPPVDKETGETIHIYNYKNLLIRKDWVEAVGEEYKYFYTPDELFDLLKKIQDEDANGNGKNDEVMYVTINNFHNGLHMRSVLTVRQQADTERRRILFIITSNMKTFLPMLNL